MLKSPRSSTCRGSGEPGTAGGRHPPASQALARLLTQGPAQGGGSDEPYLLLTVGKGGTGKTTVAAALAVALAERGFSVLAASIDPAHNLGDVLDVPLGGEPKPVGSSGRLWAMEVDMSRALERYLERQAEELRAAYRYLQALNLDGYLDTLRYSPGVEEHAALEEIGRLLETAKGRGVDVLMVDTPPTGLTLRVLSLPAVSVRWAKHLAQVRRALLERRYALERVLGPQRARVGDEEVELPSREERDPISQILRAYRESMEALQQRLQDVQRCGVVVVKNPDRLSMFETARALEGLAAFGVPVAMVVINKGTAENGAFATSTPAGPTPAAGESARYPESAPYPTYRIPLLSPEPIGLEALRAVAAFILPGDGPVK